MQGGSVEARLDYQMRSALAGLFAALLVVRGRAQAPIYFTPCHFSRVCAGATVAVPLNDSLYVRTQQQTFYTVRTNYFLVLAPPPGFRVSVSTLSFSTEGGFDHFVVSSGGLADAPGLTESQRYSPAVVQHLPTLVYVGNGFDIPPVFAGFSSTTITLQLFSDEMVTTEGVAMEVYLEEFSCGGTLPWEDDSSRECVASCPVGKYASSFSRACLSCPAGKASSQPNATLQSACRECPPGTYGAGDGAPICYPCEYGTYSNSSGEKFFCRNLCGFNHIGSTLGATNRNSCSSCPSGLFSYNASSCATCPAGKYSAPASQLALPEGTAYCLDCLPGTYSQEGSGTCAPCNASFYSSAGASMCIPCASGSSSYAGSSSCFSCDGVSCEVTDKAERIYYLFAGRKDPGNADGYGL